MSRFQFGLAGAAALALLAVGAPRGLAFAQNGARNGGATPPTYAVSPETVNLSPIVVQGHKLPLPIVLQTIKTGLKLPWTNDRNDTRIRCRFETQAGSHLPILYCEGNRRHNKRLVKLHTDMLTSMAAGGSLPMENAMLSHARHHWVNAGALKALLKKLPPANSSYTLRITEHGKPFIDYVVKDGELVKILRYPKAGQSSH